MEEVGAVIDCRHRDSDSSMYVMPAPPVEQFTMTTKETSEYDVELWHLRLAHINLQDLEEVQKHAEVVPKLENTS